MVVRSLLVFSVLSLVSCWKPSDELKWRPDWITKESILANHSILSNEKPQFAAESQLVFIDPEHPNGQELALKRAERIDYLSNMWFNVVPEYDSNEDIINVEILGMENIDNAFMREMRKRNQNIKIVPRFNFTEFTYKDVDNFVYDEEIVLKVAQKIIKFCKEHNFDGLVLETFRAFVKNLNNRSSSRNVIEAWEQMAKLIRRGKLFAILSIDAPIELSARGDMPHSSMSVVRIPTDATKLLMNAYDRVVMWPDIKRQPRNFMWDMNYKRNLYALNEITKKPNVFMGIYFNGVECRLDKWNKGICDRNWSEVGFERFMEVLNMEDSVLMFDEDVVEHQLTSEELNAFIAIPSLSQLEFVLETVTMFETVGVAIWSYGQGLDYFTNII